MLGKKFYKDNYDLEEYVQCAEWCNSNNAHIKDSGDWYEVVVNPLYIPAKEEYADKIAYTEELRAKINKLQN